MKEKCFQRKCSSQEIKEEKKNKKDRKKEKEIN